MIDGEVDQLRVSTRVVVVIRGEREIARTDGLSSHVVAQPVFREVHLEHLRLERGVEFGKDVGCRFRERPSKTEDGLIGGGPVEEDKSTSMPSMDACIIACQ